MSHKSIQVNLSKRGMHYMTSKYIHFFILGIGFLLITSKAALPEEKLPTCLHLPENSGVVKNITKQNSIMLHDGRELVLANVYVKKKESHLFIKEAILNKKVFFYSSGRLKDRYNRLIVQIFINEAGKRTWLQETLIQKGHAVAMALPTNWLCATELLSREKNIRARDEIRKTIELSFPIIRVENTQLLNQKQQGSFQMVKGKVFSISRTTQNTYINFSKNWRKDFTAVISNHLLKRKKSRWPKLKLLKGKTIILRGWLDHYNGPLIRLETPEMIEIMN
jgi:hypothetical protein